LALFVLVALAVALPYEPPVTRAVIRVPAVPLGIKTFSATVSIIPTGVRTYPATTARGTLTITNGSIIGQSIPTGFTIQGVVTDNAIYVPSGSANGYGWAQVSAHALNTGKAGNLPAYAINSVIGASVYIRNLSAFSGGHDAYSVKYVIAQDKQAALTKARNVLTLISTGLHYPCEEYVNYKNSYINIYVNWHCQFVTYTIPSYMRVLRVRLSGKNLLVDVAFTPPPVHIWEK
jgi:Baseplate J-like protein